MDGRDFDNWARKLARLRSRRDVLKAGIGAALAGGVLAGRGITPHRAAAQTGPNPICDGADPSTECGLGCLCATYVSGGAAAGGVCYQDAGWCNSPGGCDGDDDCPSGFICATNNAALDCAPEGSAGVCVFACFVPATTTTAPPTTTTTAAPTTTTAAPTTTTTAAPTTTTTTTGGPTTTTTTTTSGPTTTTTTTAPPPGITVDPTRGAVGSSFDLTIVSFPPSTEVTLSFIPDTGPTFGLGTVTTDAAGGATATRTVPTAPGGAGEVRAIAGNETESAPFEVAPRIRVTPSTVEPGQTVSAAVTGFGQAEEVRIRWRVGDVFVQVGTLTTGANGAGAVDVIVPANAPAGATAVRAESAAFAAQTNAVTVDIPGEPSVTIEPTRGTVNTGVDYTVADFPANAAGTITWRRTSGSLIEVGTFQTDASGAASGSFPVPATPGGAGQVITFASGTVSETATYEVAPRIKVGSGAVGDMVGVSLRGFGRQEQGIRIRWRVNGVWTQIATASTSNTGSANFEVEVPEGATVGANSVRADGPQFRAQTNAAIVTE